MVQTSTVKDADCVVSPRILTGTSPSRVAVELPDRIELVINVKTAKRIGLQVPKSVLVRADCVIN